MKSQTINLTYQGLLIEAEIEDFDPGVRTFANGDPGYPPEGGYCEFYTWEVEDIDEVLENLEQSAEGYDQLVRGYYSLYRCLPDVLVKRINRDWDESIREAAEEYFHEG